MRFIDRLLTIVVTVTLTSAAWILFGSTILGRAADERFAVEAARQVGSETGRGEASTAPAAGGPAQTEAADLTVPVTGVNRSDLADSFTDERGGGSRLHEAIDILAPSGTPVVAARGGKVEKLFVSEAGGNTIYIRTAGGTQIHYYAHLQDYAPGLSEGQLVRQGQQLGTVGNSGNADPAAPHLHFAMMRTTADAGWWEPSSAINPYPLLRN